ncbi:hypothetical protein H0H87_002385, partial [Tephrocybe sp. NHM501043]
MITTPEANLSISLYHPHSRVAPIQRVPNELLLGVFTELHKYSKHINNDDLLQTDFYNTLFPYAISEVCRLWRDVVQTKSAFWTRIFANIDCPGALARVERQLLLLKDGELEFVFRRSLAAHAKYITPQSEMAQFFPFCNLIQKNLPRCRSLLVKLTHACSLPTISPGLLSEAPLLNQLVLRKQNHDALNADDLMINGHLNFRRGLSFKDDPDWVIDLNGQGFVPFFMMASSWISSFDSRGTVEDFGSTTCLRLSHFNSANYSSLTADDLLECLSHLPSLAELELDHVNFIDSGLEDYPPLFETNIMGFKFTGLLEALMDAIFSTLDFPNLVEATIIDCELASSLNAPVCNLFLENIRADSPSMLSFLQDWIGPQILANHCPGIDDAFLGAIARHPLCIGWDIYLKHCNSFTAEGLASFMRRISTRHVWISSCSIVHDSFPSNEVLNELSNLVKNSAFEWNDYRCGKFKL